ncbi:STING domain-containing protein [Flaviaesturariibacter amylovorans]|uniref:CD-NTase-associated protein 12 n=1 Tax=Flaviaesturariibacter amylovorans TaxID=1084520 RepID=A0ABP8H620_9BACT
MDFTPNIFIGSSREGQKIALQIAEEFEGFAQCRLWMEAFDFGASNYDNLIRQIALYDYAILIATADDVLESRKQVFHSVRDNVLFEFGLFAGGLGKSRAFYIIEEGTKIPSDLNGISLPSLPKRTSKKFPAALADIVSKIKAHILGKEHTFDLSFLPSTVLAYGYFSNFVERTVERLLEDKAEGKLFTLQNDSTFQIESLKFSILIPDDLSDDMFKKVSAKRLKDGWQKLKVDPKHVRDYDFSIDITKASEGLLHLVDIPFTLNALNLAIELYSTKEHLGKDARESLLEYREIRNFKRTLEYLVARSTLTRRVVSIEIVPI